MINYLKHIKLKTVFIITVFAALGFMTGRYFFPQKVVLTYISQSELLELEKERLQKVSSSSRQLFYGFPEKAIKLIEAIQLKRSKGSNIVLLSEKTIYGNIKSISKEVHAEVLQCLKDASNFGLTK